jgi:hypothetical protein
MHHPKLVPERLRILVEAVLGAITADALSTIGSLIEDS